MAESVDDMRNRALRREDLLLNLRSPYSNLQQVLGTTVSDTGNICLNDNINPASKCKPINYNTQKTLTAAQRKGLPSENNEGYYYGVKVMAGASLADIHSIGYDYLRPIGGAYFYRLTDFIGYHHKATPNCDATIVSSKIYFDVPNNLILNFDVDYLGTNTTGIDVKEIMRGIASNTDDEYVFARVYPIIAIGNKISVLKNENGVVQPIFYENAWGRTFYADLSTGNFEEGTYPVTLGFMFRPSSTGASFPIDGSWVEIDSVNEARYTEKVLVAYSCHNLQKTLERYNLLAPPFTPSVGANRNGVIIIPTYTEEPTAQCTITVSFTTGGMTVTKTETFEVSSAMPTINITWRELGMTYMSGMMLTYSCYIISKYANSSAQTVGPEVSETITVQ